MIELNYFAPTKSKSSTSSPVASLKAKWDLFVHNRGVENLFYDRNDPKVVTPFLEGLGCQYEVVQQLVLVKSAPDVEEKLEKLGYKETSKVLPKNKKFEKLISQMDLEYASRMYQPSHSIDIHLIPHKFWTVATTAHYVAKQLKAPDEDFLDYFLRTYKSLLELATQQPQF